MAGYREHISVSGLLGVALGVTSVGWLGFTPAQGLLAATLTWVAGMLPDLDSQSGRPVRELFALIAAAAPLILMPRLLHYARDTEMALFYAVLVYATVRYGGAYLLGKLAVHRGMFHSIPALLIASQLTFLAYDSPRVQVRALMALAVAVGFASHLLLDELYSVEWTGIRIKLNQAAGSALKFFSRSVWANLCTYALCGLATWATMLDLGVMNAPWQRTVTPFGLLDPLLKLFR